MLPLALGLAALAGLMWAARSFSTASVAGVKGLLAWIAALGGISLMAMLLLTGRGATAFYGLVLLGPLVWDYWKKHQGTQGRGTRAAMPRMDRAEALAVLGLPDRASDSDIRAAWVRLMRAVHPDSGGTDWLAARVNQAKDVLLRR